MKNFNLVRVIAVDTYAYALISKETLIEARAIRVFSESLVASRTAPNTIKTYSQCAAKYLDFAVEISSGNYGIEGFDTESSASVVQLFFQTLSIGPGSNREVVREISSTLGIGPCKRKTVNIYRAALHKFFSILGKYNGELCSVVLGEGVSDLKFLPDQISSRRKISSFESSRLKMNSVMAGCIAGGGGCIEINSLPNYSQGRGGSRLYKDTFCEFESLECNLRKMSNLRDQCLFYFLCASGARVSEGLQLLADDIDVNARKVFVRDPRDRTDVYYKMGLDSVSVRSLSYKGRLNPEVNLIEPYASLFWHAYGALVKSNKYMPIVSGDGAYIMHRFIFRVLFGKNKGAPICLSINTSNLSRSIKSVFKDVDPSITLHHTRHAYVSYVANDAPYHGQRGAGIDVAQRLVGHVNASSTKLYDRREQRESLAEINKAYLAEFSVDMGGV